ncbi:MAG: arginine--tRNA ligase [Bacteroidetes bacterium CG18_big_fil_WC_8_21_14_2_50_41_14]|nr:MAG: arginine--tRNA ligase [Bacteroidetes bacterium CG18_big_fil_WC_8_21_14_2_50_41_14]PJB56281.1 MAG: arginine--tRNA ligase [Bacteroidetes bacterium CG_4_9_14_3_um_filter_41_19]
MIETTIALLLRRAIVELYGQEPSEDLIQVQKTRPEFQGDYTIVVFPFLKMSRKNPEQTANEIGNYLMNSSPEITAFNVIKGFLNLLVSDEYWMRFFTKVIPDDQFGFGKRQDTAPVVIEYSSPNTNKPLHLGHVRNNLLGWSVSAILKANGIPVKKVNLVNDRGIHICKSMLAWQKWGQSATPETTGQKGDKLVGDYYVLFDREYKKEIKTLVDNGMKEDEAKNSAPILLEAKQMLKKWEDGDDQVRKLWYEMNQWVYAGFDITYNRMGIDFDKVYYESETYLLGKALVEEGLQKDILFKKADGSVWCDLTSDGLDEKLLLRADGTSVYMTQDLGTAQLRHDDYHPGKLVYVVGNEQNYHFDVLKLVLKKLGKEWADSIEHLSYGMVELPEGKMKSREGTVVDADDLMEEMYQTAKTTTEALGKFDDFTEEESHQLYNILSQGALKYFILKVDPKKTMTFNPAESIDFTGNTGPFIQYTHARIKSILRKADEAGYPYLEIKIDWNDSNEKEKSLLKLLHDFPQVIQQAGENFSPALVANYAYEVAKEFNQFYHALIILKEEDEAKRTFRLQLSFVTARTIRQAMKLLGAEVPERM